MKKLLLLSFLFITSISIAASTAVFDKLHQANAPSPQSILQKIENEYAKKAVVVEFELEFEHGKTTYEVTLYQAEKHRFIELLVDQQGKLIELEYDAPEIDEQEEIAAATLMSQKGLTMQGLVAQLDSPAHQYLLEAQLEQDMGITYMVATFVTEQGRHKKAIDLATGKDLPLLRWGN
ncbi:hypothetical protein RC083_01065 [Pseudoalteromonas haloplanktis]|uniref:PepSY domain-containing protein n=1 Tax=Pseudoalteromonas haloplanktis TaxID=228 RepID=A0ABU1B8B4_PSEHA|nr:hypothetical protein [Pseudoalteromonas haloplanktis]MDQ9090174.1 hypothetical protein [Pseudoalteromonas haloplanktis]